MYSEQYQLRIYVALRNRALGTALIASVDIARVVGTESTVSFIPSRCWRLGLAGSGVLLLQKIHRSIAKRDASYFVPRTSGTTTRTNGV